jgi:hypothetical protein
MSTHHTPAPTTPAPHKPNLTTQESPTVLKNTALRNTAARIPRYGKAAIAVTHVRAAHCRCYRINMFKAADRGKLSKHSAHSDTGSSNISHRSTRNALHTHRTPPESVMRKCAAALSRPETAGDTHHTNSTFTYARCIPRHLKTSQISTVPFIYTPAGSWHTGCGRARQQINVARRNATDANTGQARRKQMAVT